MNLGFGSDNHSGIHPQILNAITTKNSGHAPSYGTDEYTLAVIEKLKTLFGKSCDIYFVFNGTAANVLCLNSLVSSYHAILCAETAHLNLDECGAPEKAIGCKVLTVPTNNGKIKFQDFKKHLIRHGDQHYSQPKVLSITLPTEYGTMYSLAELKELRALTRDHNLYLHIDGARFIYAPHFLKCSFLDITENLGIDALSLGGTKNGLLFGEACLIYNSAAKENFKFIRKQNMQLPSKSRFVAAQFEELFVNGLHKEISSHCHKLALLLAKELKSIPEIQVTQTVEANSVFAIFPKNWTKKLRENHFFYIWDEDTWEARLMVSFDLTEEKIFNFVSDIRALKESLQEKE